jgi:hypothetical protein
VERTAGSIGDDIVRGEQQEIQRAVHRPIGRSKTEPPETGDPLLRLTLGGFWVTGLAIHLLGELRVRTCPGSPGLAQWYAGFPPAAGGIGDRTRLEAAKFGDLAEQRGTAAVPSLLSSRTPAWPGAARRQSTLL